MCRNCYFTGMLRENHEIFLGNCRLHACINYTSVKDVATVVILKRLLKISKLF